MREASAPAHLHLHLGRVRFEPRASIIASVSIVERVDVVLFRRVDLVIGVRVRVRARVRARVRVRVRG